MSIRATPSKPSTRAKKTRTSAIPSHTRPRAFSGLAYAQRSDVGTVSFRYEEDDSNEHQYLVTDTLQVRAGSRGRTHWRMLRPAENPLRLRGRTILGQVYGHRGPRDRLRATFGRRRTVDSIVQPS